MATASKAFQRPLFLGVEGGATRTVALLVDGSGRPLRRIETAPTNVRFLTDAKLTARLRSVAKAFPRPDAVGLGLAGVCTETDRQRVRRVVERVWPGVPYQVTHDLETGLAAADSVASTPRPGRKRRGAKPVCAARVLVLSGTGSCCFGKSAKGRTIKLGGWGHLLSDRGSGYDLGLSALRAVIAHYDARGRWPLLGQRLLAELQLNEPTELIQWCQHATKKDVARLAPVVFRTAQRGDRLAARVIAEAARQLAHDAAACARRLARPGAPVEFILAGGVLLNQPRFAAQVKRALRRMWPTGRCDRLPRESVWGAVHLAQRVASGWAQKPF